MREIFNNIRSQAFLYSLWYFTFSILGNYNNFFFAAHLLDVAIGFKTLRTILQSVTHNGKQLVLTVMLLTIVVYIYTVIAFNFFRKFYIQEEDDEVDKKCHDMLTVRRRKCLSGSVVHKFHSNRTDSWSCTFVQWVTKQSPAQWEKRKKEKKRNE